eukprot:SAG31_NODE_282_length_18516_cov_9.338600_8_plen_286_part_00
MVPSRKYLLSRAATPVGGCDGDCRAVATGTPALFFHWCVWNLHPLLRGSNSVCVYLLICTVDDGTGLLNCILWRDGFDGGAVADPQRPPDIGLSTAIPVDARPPKPEDRNAKRRNRGVAWTYAGVMASEDGWPGFALGQLVGVTGPLGWYNDALQLRADFIRPHRSGVDDPNAETLWMVRPPKYLKISENISKYLKISENISRYLKISENIAKYLRPKFYTSLKKHTRCPEAVGVRTRVAGHSNQPVLTVPQVTAPLLQLYGDHLLVVAMANGLKRGSNARKVSS